MSKEVVFLQSIHPQNSIYFIWMSEKNSVVASLYSKVTFERNFMVFDEQTGYQMEANCIKYWT